MARIKCNGKHKIDAGAISVTMVTWELQHVAILGKAERVTFIHKLHIQFFQDRIFYWLYDYFLFCFSSIYGGLWVTCQSSAPLTFS